MSVKTERSVDREGVCREETNELLLSEETGTSQTINVEDDDTDGVPFDKGWAWMVLLGCFINYVLIHGYVKSSGVFLVELLRKFRAPVSRTALLFAIRGGVFSITGLFVMNAVVGRLGYRTTVLIGAALMSLSAILSSFANDLTLLMCLQAGLLGLSDSMLTSPGEVLTATYFRKRRSLALAIVKTGASIGSVAYPPLLTYLLSEYGLQGTLLLTGAICLHSLPAALLLRPISYFRARAQRSANRTGNAKVSCTNGDEGSSEGRRASSTELCLIRSNSNVEISAEKRAEYSKADTKEKVSQCLQHEECSQDSEEELKTVHDVQEIPLSASTECPSKRKLKSEILMSSESGEKRENPEQRFNHEVCSINDAEICRVQDTITVTSDVQVTDDQNRAPGSSKSTLQRLKSTLLVLDFSLFRRPSFCLLFAYFTFSQTINVAVDYFPALAEQNDVTKSQAAQLLSIVGGLDLVSRFFSGFLANLNVVPVPAMLIFALGVLGVVYQCVRFLTSFGLLVILAVVQGLLAGVVNCLVPMLIVHVVGLEGMAKGIGFQYLAEGSFLAAYHPFLGFIRDTTGSYAAVYHVLGGGLLIAATLLLCEELVRRQELKHEAKQRDIDCSVSGD